MTITKEEELAVLYALYCLQPRTDAGSIIAFIREKELLLPKSDDNEPVGNGEPKIVNRIRWIRENLREGGFLDGSVRGRWILTAAGERRLIAEAIQYHDEETAGFSALSDARAERLSQYLLGQLRKFGAFASSRVLA